MNGVEERPMIPPSQSGRNSPSGKWLGGKGKRKPPQGDDPCEGS
ncbi:hypothetical protein HMPREF1556_01878 [Porphyromonas sp. oral taxon 278 str. W7784]|nr:hypothetical protein HMPREF1556_01878 [Porphyromonas sp. oral taxon 278 str. W7784]